MTFEKVVHYLGHELRVSGEYQADRTAPDKRVFYSIDIDTVEIHYNDGSLKGTFMDISELFDPLKLHDLEGLVEARLDYDYPDI